MGSKLSRLMRDMEWWVAIRPHLDIPMEKQHSLEFTVLKNTWRYWCADPFVFEHKGITYLFMEVFDRVTQQGSIAYRIYKNGKISRIHICLKSEHHFSYPFLYRDGDDIYMLPECYQSGKLMAYRAVHFPDEWEPVQTLLENVQVCDSNLLESDGQKYMLTMELTGEPFVYDKLAMYRQEKGKWIRAAVEPVVTGADRARNGGAVFRDHGRLVRPAQDCADSYGSSLRFFLIDKLGTESYAETELCRWTADQIRTSSRRIFDGIHTFNTNNTYDVIDLRQENRFQWTRALYLINCLSKKTRRY